MHGSDLATLRHLLQLGMRTAEEQRQPFLAHLISLAICEIDLNGRVRPSARA